MHHLCGNKAGLCGVFAALAVGALGACGPSVSQTRPRTGAGNGEGHASTYLGDSIDFSATSSPRFELSLDVRRSGGCSQTFVSTRTRGRITVVVSRYGVSRLTVELDARERSGPTRRPARGGSRVSRRRWQRVYRWAGKAGFMGPSAQLHLKPVGKGCSHRALSGIIGAGCRSVVPALVVECNPARLADPPRNIRLRRPLPRASAAAKPTGQRHLTCAIEVAGRRDRVRLPPDLRFLDRRRLLLSQQGRPELLLDLFYDANQIEGVLIRPRPRLRARPRPRPRRNGAPIPAPTPARGDTR